MMEMEFSLRKKIEPQLIGILAFFYFLATSIHLAKSAYLGYLEGKTLDWGLTLFIYALDYLVVLFYMILIAINTKKLLIKKVAWTKILMIHLIFSLLLGVLLHILEDLFKWGMGLEANFNFQWERFVHYIDLDFFTYFSLIFIIYSYYYFQISRDREQQHAALENQLSTAKIRMLTSQLQPHFLFNTINCIISLIETNPRKAQDTLVDLSDFYRAITKNSVSHFITIEQELKILKYYLNILKVRFQENLLIEEDIETPLLSELCPAITLQPLIENSINHGYSYSKDTLRIIIRIFSQEERIFVVVENNGEPLQERSLDLREGIGLSNTYERLQNLYAGQATFVVRNRADGSGVENIISFPFHGKALTEMKDLVLYPS